MKRFLTCILRFPRKIRKFLLILLILPLLFSGDVLDVLGDVLSVSQQQGWYATPYYYPYYQTTLLDGIMFSVTYEIEDEPSAALQTAWMPVSAFRTTSIDIQDLAIGPSGSLWIATNSGLNRLSNGNFRFFTRKNGMPHNQVFIVIATARGVFAGTEAGLVWFDDLAPSENMSPILILPEIMASVSSIVKHKDGYLFLLDSSPSIIGKLELTSEGMPECSMGYFSDIRIRRLLAGGENELFCQLPDRRWRQCELSKSSENETVVKFGEFLDISPVDVKKIESKTVILTENELLYREDTASWRVLTDFDEKDNADGFLKSNRNKTKLWFGKNEHLWLINPGNGEKLYHLKLHPGMKVRTVAEEPNGRLWVGTEDSGLLMAVSNKENGWILPFTKALVDFKYEFPKYID